MEPILTTRFVPLMWTNFDTEHTASKIEIAEENHFYIKHKAIDH